MSECGFIKQSGKAFNPTATAHVFGQNRKEPYHSIKKEKRVQVPTTAHFPKAMYYCLTFHVLN